MKGKWKVRRVSDSIGTIWKEVFRDDSDKTYRFTDTACAVRFADKLNSEVPDHEAD